MKLTSIISVIIGGLAIAFAFQNNQSITLTFFSSVFTGSVALMILAVLLIGFTIAIILFVPEHIAMQWKIKTLTKENERLQKKIADEVIQYEAPGLGVEGDAPIDL